MIDTAGYMRGDVFVDSPGKSHLYRPRTKVVIKYHPSKLTMTLTPGGSRAHMGSKSYRHCTKLDLYQLKGFGKGAFKIW